MKVITDWILFWLGSLAVAFFSKMPLGAAMFLGRLGGTCLFYISKRRHTAYADLKASFGDRFSEKDRWRIIKSHFQHLGQTAVEVMRFPLLDQEYIERQIHIHHPERFYQAIEEGKGVILLTGHFGNWELLQIISGILGKPIHVLARNQKHNRLNQLLNKLRESHGSVAISRGAGVRDLLRALRRQELVGVVGDQDAGKHAGLIIPLFGRKTTLPTGAFDLALRTGAPILPCFIVRKEDARHEIFVEAPIHCEKMRDYDAPTLEPLVDSFVETLERFIGEFPNQWLWASKRWKHTWTKRILILSDGKPGHVKQSEAIAQQIQSIKTQYNREGMEYPTQVLEVKFQSEWKRKLFPFFSLFFIPWAQGRLGWLSFFFDAATQRMIRKSSADFIISAGSNLSPLNLCMARESCGKSIVLMRPGFPFNFYKYDLAIIPAHDRGVIPHESFRTLLTPSTLEPDELELAAFEISKSLREPDRIKLALFLGGPTRRYQMDLTDVERVISNLEQSAQGLGDYVVTTSRRTPEMISSFLKQKLPNLPGCQMLVVASEDKRSEVVPGMMSLADILIVTEDSISMISEAVSSGKKVIVLSFGTKGLPDKHHRFQEILLRESAVTIAVPSNLQEKIRAVKARRMPLVIHHERQALQKKLQEIL